MSVTAARSGGGKLEQTRGKLVAAVRAEVEACGDFNAEAVASRAGISVGTFYNHFASKDEALVAAGEEVLREFLDMVAGQCRIDILLETGLGDFCADWLANARPLFARNASLLRLFMAGTHRSEELRALARRHQEGLLAIYRRFIELGQAARVIRRGDSDAIARVLLVTAESWHHPMMLQFGTDSVFYQALADSLARILRPEDER